MHYWEGEQEPIPEDPSPETGGTVCLMVVVGLAALICVLLAFLW